MFKNIIDNIISQQSHKVELEKEFIYLDEILDNPELDLAIKQYFSAEVDWWLYVDRIQRETSKNFNYYEDDLIAIFQQIDSLLKEKARFTLGDFKKIISNAVKTRFNLLIRPRITLSWFIFKGEPTKSVEEILLKLNYFSDYIYIINPIIEEFNEDFKSSQRKLFSRMEFEKIVKLNDDNYIYSISPEQFVDTLIPLFDLFNPIDLDGTKTLPLEALLIFLDDKGLIPVLKGMQLYASENGISEFNSKDLLNVFNNLVHQFDNNPEYKKFQDEQEFVEYPILEVHQTEFHPSNEEESLIVEKEIVYSLEELNENNENENHLLDEIENVILKDEFASDEEETNYENNNNELPDLDELQNNNFQIELESKETLESIPEINDDQEIIENNSELEIANFTDENSSFINVDIDNSNEEIDYSKIESENQNTDDIILDELENDSSDEYDPYVTVISEDIQNIIEQDIEVSNILNEDLDEIDSIEIEEILHEDIDEFLKEDIEVAKIEQNYELNNSTIDFENELELSKISEINLNNLDLQNSIDNQLDEEINLNSLIFDADNNDSNIDQFNSELIDFESIQLNNDFTNNNFIVNNINKNEENYSIDIKEDEFIEINGLDQEIINESLLENSNIKNIKSEENLSLDLINSELLISELENSTSEDLNNKRTVDLRESHYFEEIAMIVDIQDSSEEYKKLTINDFISPTQQEDFIFNIFLLNEIAYKKTLEIIDNCEYYEDAIIFFENYLNSNKIDPDFSVKDEFINCIKKRFE